MSKNLFPPLALVCALALVACGGDDAADADASSSESTAASPHATANPPKDPEFAVVEKIRQANADDPRIVFTRAVTTAVANRRTMLIDCSLKPAEARASCQSAAQEVYAAARADATAQLEAATAGQTPSDAEAPAPEAEVDPAASTASNGG